MGEAMIMSVSENEISGDRLAGSRVDDSLTGDRWDGRSSEMQGVSWAGGTVAMELIGLAAGSDSPGELSGEEAMARLSGQVIGVMEVWVSSALAGERRVAETVDVEVVGLAAGEDSPDECTGEEEVTAGEVVEIMEVLALSTTLWAFSSSTSSRESRFAPLLSTSSTARAGRPSVSSSPRARHSSGPETSNSDILTIYHENILTEALFEEPSKDWNEIFLVIGSFCSPKVHLYLSGG